MEVPQWVGSGDAYANYYKYVLILILMEVPQWDTGRVITRLTFVVKES